MTDRDTERAAEINRHRKADLARYEEKLQRHDWLWEMRDAHDVARHARQAEFALQEEALGDRAKTELFDSYREERKPKKIIGGGY